tara:strand:- start:2115 stop:2891 length:777 start_codon:yes stop_codon:yes gene_type:complete
MAQLENNIKKPNNSTDNTIVIKKETIKRLASDVKDIIKNPLISEGIHYVHDEDDILIGKALIIGPSDTPYANGYYFFKFKFPTDYPYSPPHVTYHTNDGNTRFNPNLYRNGKVCISILNTWRGPQWTSCQTIRSVLMCLCGSVLNDEPLLNEPGITKNHLDYKNYLDSIRYKNYETAILCMLNSDYIQEQFTEFYSVIVNHFLENYHLIINQLNKDTIDDASITISIYRMTTSINYTRVRDKLESTYVQLQQYKDLLE